MALCVVFGGPFGLVDRAVDAEAKEAADLGGAVRGSRDRRRRYDGARAFTEVPELRTQVARLVAEAGNREDKRRQLARQHEL